MEYLDFLPGIDGLEGDDGVPADLNTVSEAAAADADSSIWAILAIELNRRSRRMSSSISSCALRRSLNSAALALFHREKRISVGGRCRVVVRCGGGEGLPFGDSGANIGNGIANFSAIF